MNEQTNERIDKQKQSAPQLWTRQLTLNIFAAIGLPLCTANFVIRKPKITEQISGNMLMSQFNFSALYVPEIMQFGK